MQVEYVDEQGNAVGQAEAIITQVNFCCFFNLSPFFYLAHTSAQFSWSSSVISLQSQLQAALSQFIVSNINPLAFNLAQVSSGSDSIATSLSGVSVEVQVCSQICRHLDASFAGQLTKIFPAFPQVPERNYRSEWRRYCSNHCFQGKPFFFCRQISRSGCAGAICSIQATSPFH